MRNVELLAPAGSKEALQAAIINGANAVYLGGVHYGARAFASNFDMQQMQTAIAYAHQYGVKVFVTVNTLIYQTEIASCLNYIEQLQAMDVDAVLIQDLGLLACVRTRFPDLEIHASTQMHVHNPQGIALLKKLGVKRVVLPRETSIEDIRKYTKLGLDVEVFVQGALCVSYSGQCLMSSLTLDRSGNRGECAQNCRMQYSLERNNNGKWEQVASSGQYLLSTKDLNTLDHIHELIDAGVYSFKIEGRMKRSEYVALMSQNYRRAIDAYLNGEVFCSDANMMNDMAKVFNRGFTAGCLFHETGSRFMNTLRPNHMGVEVGKISAINKNKVEVVLSKSLSQGDGIRILGKKEDCGFTINRMYKDGLLVNKAFANDKVAFDKTFDARVGSVVLKTSDKEQLLQLQKACEQRGRSVLVYGMFEMLLNQPACLHVMDEEGREVKVYSDCIVEKALKTPLQAERIEAQLHKSKDTIFDFVNIEMNIDENCTMPIKQLNQMRRDALTQLAQLRSVTHLNRRVQDLEYVVDVEDCNVASIICVVHNQDQYDACKQMGIETIYASVDTMGNQYELLRYPRVMKEEYVKDNCMIQEMGGCFQASNFICDTSCNVSNASSVAFYRNQGAKGICFSLEMSVEDCVEIVKAHNQKYGTYHGYIYPIYGREELMLCEYCAIHMLESDAEQKHCGYCKKHDYTLVDLKKHRYPLLCDRDCRMHILNEEARNHIDEVAYLKENGITSFLLTFTNESKEECIHVLRQMLKC